MRYKLFLVTVLSMCTFAGCQRKEETVNGFAQNPVIENEATKDNNETESSDLNDITEQTEESLNSNTSEPSDIDGQSPMTDLTTVPETEVNGIDQDSTVKNPSQESDPTLPTQSVSEDSDTIPSKEPMISEPTQAPNVMPTKVPVPTKVPTVGPSTPAPTKTPSVTPTKVPVVTATPVPTKTPTRVPTPTKVPTVTPAPTKAPTQAPSVSIGDKLSVRGESISIGDSKSSVVSKLGNPSRTDATEYSYDFMVYSDNYKKFVMIAIEGNKVVGWYTDSTDFEYNDLTTSSGVSAINNAYGKSLSMQKTLSVTSDGRTITFFMDTLGDSTIDGILVTSSIVSKGSVTDSVLTAWEKEVFDLTNSFRARNSLSALTWSSTAAKAAYLHSKDMADNNYFSHNGLDGSTPSDRLKEQGISFTMSGENIIGGYGNALYSSNGWMNSSGHRTNMLNKSFTHLGVGFVLGGSYGNYCTQNFYK